MRRICANASLARAANQAAPVSGRSSGGCAGDRTGVWRTIARIRARRRATGCAQWLSSRLTTVLGSTRFSGRAMQPPHSGGVCYRLSFTSRRKRAPIDLRGRCRRLLPRRLGESVPLLPLSGHLAVLAISETAGCTIAHAELTRRGPITKPCATPCATAACLRGTLQHFSPEASARHRVHLAHAVRQ